MECHPTCTNNSLSSKSATFLWKVRTVIKSYHHETCVASPWKKINVFNFRFLLSKGPSKKWTWIHFNVTQISTNIDHFSLYTVRECRLLGRSTLLFGPDRHLILYQFPWDHYPPCSGGWMPYPYSYELMIISFNFHVLEAATCCTSPAAGWKLPESSNM